jgi:hypothetical protein
MCINYHSLVIFKFLVTLFALHPLGVHLGKNLIWLHLQGILVQIMSHLLWMILSKGCKGCGVQIDVLKKICKHKLYMFLKGFFFGMGKEGSK